ncbi:MAG: helix-turn-helix transcriptional regulator [Rubrobacter sp.]|nr:helix-turn-helix transcriptional regulator [Rubrobacter sp.]
MEDDLEDSEDGSLSILQEQPLRFSPGSSSPWGSPVGKRRCCSGLQGKTDKQVVALRYVSPLTVKKHLKHVYEKLRVKSRTEAVALALKSFGLC